MFDSSLHYVYEIVFFAHFHCQKTILPKKMGSIQQMSAGFWQAVRSYNSHFMIVGALFLLPMIVYIVTLVQFKIVMNDKTGPRRPPKLPYLIPGLESVLQVNGNPFRFIKTTR